MSHQDKKGENSMGMTTGLLLGGLSAATSLVGGLARSQQQRAQAEAQKTQAAEYRRQAELAGQRGEIEAQNIERRKIKLRREFNEIQSRNRSLLAAGNVDMASGSALDLSLGNIDRFAADLGDNAYEKALKQWESRENSRILDWQARQAEAQASYLNRTAGNLGTSLLDAGIAGASGFLSGYTFGGGKLADLWKGGQSAQGGLSGLLAKSPRPNFKAPVVRFKM